MGKEGRSFSHLITIHFFSHELLHAWSNGRQQMEDVPMDLLNITFIMIWITHYLRRFRK